MTWVKLGAELPGEAEDLSDGAVRLHVEALCWSSARLLDLLIPKAHLVRFSYGADAPAAAAELVAVGWWEDRGDDGWYIGVHHADWQLSADLVRKLQKSNVERQAAWRRRKQLHDRGDHSECFPKTCDWARNALANAPRNAAPVRTGPDRPEGSRSGSGEGQTPVTRYGPEQPDGTPYPGTWRKARGTWERLLDGPPWTVPKDRDGSFDRLLTLSDSALLGLVDERVLPGLVDQLVPEWREAKGDARTPIAATIRAAALRRLERDDQEAGAA